jgi:hypothetical protein
VSRALLAVFACLLSIGAAASFAAPYGQVANNPADRLADLAIDDYAYDHAKRCRKRPMPGALAMVEWLEQNASGVSWGIMRCSKLSKHDYSLHAEGRAIDWHLDAAVPADRREAKRLIMLLLASDTAGNPHALARRMGIQEIIWDCRSWWAGAERLGPYSLCFDRRGKPVKGVNKTLAHRDHIHIGLSLAGARKRTSFWASGS